MMASKLTVRQKVNIIEHYAYRTSDKCVKLDTVNQMIGGLYDHHPCINYKTAKYIYDRFVAVDEKLENNSYETLKVENLQLEKYDGETLKFRIHTFNRDRCTTRRKALWLNAGILMQLPHGLGYCRVFRMPCKFHFCSFITV